MSGAATEPLSFRVEPTEADSIAANWLVIRHRWLWRRLIVAFLALWLVYGGLIVAINTLEYGWSAEWAMRTMLETVAYAAIVAVILIGLVLFNVPRSVKKMRADLARLTNGSDIEVYADHIRFSNAVSSATLEWHQFKRWHEGSKVMALMITDREWLLFPKSQLDPSVIAEVRNHLIAAQVERGLT